MSCGRWEPLSGTGSGDWAVGDVLTVALKHVTRRRWSSRPLGEVEIGLPSFAHYGRGTEIWHSGGSFGWGVGFARDLDIDCGGTLLPVLEDGTPDGWTPREGRESSCEARCRTSTLCIQTHRKA